MVQGTYAVALSRWLYQDGDLALRRKSEKAAGVRDWVRPEHLRAASSPRRWTQEEDDQVRDLLRRGAPPRGRRDLAVALGRTVQSVEMRVWRLRHQSPPGGASSGRMGS